MNRSMVTALCLMISMATLAQSVAQGWRQEISGSGYDAAFAVTVDSAGNVYVAGGTTTRSGFPLLNPLQPEYGGGFSDGFIAKYNAAGQRLFTTYFGGAGYDFIYAIALDSAGNIVVVGNSHSVDLPTNEDAFQEEYSGGSAFGFGDGFIAKLSNDGSELLYCTYFGGTGDEKINGLAIDLHGNIVVTGETDARNLPLKNPLQTDYGGGTRDGFVAKFAPTLRELIFSTYLGGDHSEGDQKVAVDPAGFIYVSGWTYSTNFPATAGAFQRELGFRPEFGRLTDATVSKFAPDGSLIYSTYIGSALNDTAYAIATDSEGSAYITGEIRTNFAEDPLYAGKGITFGFQPEIGRPEVDAYIAKLAPDGSKFTWFSYLGGSGQDRGYAIALDTNRNVFVTGITDSIDFPLANSTAARNFFQSASALFAKVSSDGKRLLYSTLLHAAAEPISVALAVHPTGDAVIVGYEGSGYRALPTDEPNELPPLVDDAVVLRVRAFEQPMLRIARSGGNVLVSWPTNFLDFQLEYSITPGDEWQLFLGKAAVIGRQYLVIERISAPTRFYRLRNSE